MLVVEQSLVDHVCRIRLVLSLLGLVLLLDGQELLEVSRVHCGCLSQLRIVSRLQAFKLAVEAGKSLC